MKKETAAQILKKVIIGLVLSSLLSFAIYAASALFLTVIFYHDQYGERDFTPIYICMIFFFQLAFWICYTRKSSSEFAVVTHKESFFWKEDLRETMQGEGKIIVIVMTVLAVINELALIIHPLVSDEPGNLVATVLCFMFSVCQITGLSSVVVLRTVLALLVTTSLMIFQIVWQHSRDFKKWQSPSSRR